MAVTKGTLRDLHASALVDNVMPGIVIGTSKGKCRGLPGTATERCTPATNPFALIVRRQMWRGRRTGDPRWPQTVGGIVATLARHRNQRLRHLIREIPGSTDRVMIGDAPTVNAERKARAHDQAVASGRARAMATIQLIRRLELLHLRTNPSF